MTMSISANVFKIPGQHVAFHNPAPAPVFLALYYVVVVVVVSIFKKKKFPKYT